MFRWLRKIRVDRNAASTGEEIGDAWVPFGDEKKTEAAAVAHLRGACIQAGDEFALVCRNVTAQVTVTLDGIDDVPMVAVDANPTTETGKRRKRQMDAILERAVPVARFDPNERVTVEGAAAANAYQAQVQAERDAEDAQWRADRAAASGTDSTVEAPAVTVGERAQIEPLAGMVASGPDSDVELDGANDPDLDRIPLPAAIPDAAADLAAHMAPVRSASDPWVKLDGVKLELFDGVQLWWQKFAGATAAENSARKAAQLIEEGAAPGRFSQITIAMRKGECPAV